MLHRQSKIMNIIILYGQMHRPAGRQIFYNLLMIKILQIEIKFIR